MLHLQQTVPLDIRTRLPSLEVHICRYQVFGYPHMQERCSSVQFVLPPHQRAAHRLQCFMTRRLLRTIVAHTVPEAGRRSRIAPHRQSCSVQGPKYWFRSDRMGRPTDQPQCMRNESWPSVDFATSIGWQSFTPFPREQEDLDNHRFWRMKIPGAHDCNTEAADLSGLMDMHVH